MKSTLLKLMLAATVLAVASCSRPSAGGERGADGQNATAISGNATGQNATAEYGNAADGGALRGMKVERLLPTTPVKDQGRSELCWIYAALATIEADHAATGDSVNLSTDWLARRMLMRQARLCYFSRGRRRMSMRGTLPMAIRLLREEGVVPYDSYNASTSVNWRALGRRAAMAALSQPTLTAADRAVGRVVDHVVGYQPPHVFMLGAEYTPQDFAQSVCRRGEWRMYTSFTHHPFYADIALELPDNQFGDTFYNVPLPRLMRLLDASLDAGHAVGWEGDTSEEGFRWQRGVADVPPGADCSQRGRQRLFERRLTTDDHCMAIVGRAVAPDGTRYYIAKNSWGASNARHGFILLSERYVRLKTVALMINAVK